MLGVGETMMNKTDLVPVLLEIYIMVEVKALNHLIYNKYLFNRQLTI